MITILKEMIRQYAKPIIMGSGIVEIAEDVLGVNVPSPIDGAIGLVRKIVGDDEDPVNVEEAARMFLRIFGDESEVMWPVTRQGEKVSPNYFTIDFMKGRAWVHSKYYSRGSVNAGFKRGRRSGERAGKRELATITTAQGG